ncbi:MAG TPA: co-chaperone GroES [Candidatus Paceibacterota bacterium]|jgi:chaperonin GroES|nr:co-chaperone GroES [Candidatus Paceibacterota bacterium]HOQ15654.1 co-chaperone GroES [Candidatus Paceibacterota bacterium]HRR45931.1 co-chaperone GroES [Candidatus Paceibacterota bacterium]
MNIKPLSDHIFVEPITEEKVTKSGIYLPENVEEKPMIGKVIAVGPGKTNEEGKLIPLTIKIDDKVLFTKYAPTEIKIEDKEYLVIREDDVLAIIE